MIKKILTAILLLSLKDKVKSVEALLARYKQQGWIVAIRRNTYCMKLSGKHPPAVR